MPCVKCAKEKSRIKCTSNTRPIKGRKKEPKLSTKSKYEAKKQWLGAFIGIYKRVNKKTVKLSVFSCGVFNSKSVGSASWISV